MKMKIMPFCLFLFMALLNLSACRESNVTVRPSGGKDRLSWKWIAEPGVYEDLFFAADDLIAVKNNRGKYGIINMQGEEVLPFELDEVSPFYDGLALVRRNGKISYMDKKGCFITDTAFENAYSFQENMGAVQMNHVWGYMNPKGELVIDCRYDEVKLFSEGMAAVKKKGKWGFINTAGEPVIDNRFDEVRNFNEGMAAVKRSGKWGFIDGRGRILSDIQYDEVYDFQEGCAAVRKDNKWGYTDKSGRLCVALKYDEAGSFSEEKAAVKINGVGGDLDKWAYIDKNGRTVIDFYPYDASDGRMVRVGEFHNGMAFVTKTLYCIIDAEGNDIFSGASDFFISDLTYNPEYNVIPGYVYADDAMTVKKYGLMGLDGSRRVEPVFDYIEGMAGRYVIVSNIIKDEYRKGILELIRE